MLDYLEKGDFCYLVMEYIRGRSLEQYLKDGRQFTLEEILEIGKKVLEILDYLHRQKPAIYYGDLKPANLILTRTGRLYLIDFGSAVIAYGQAGQRCKGTVGYAAPEQFRGILEETSDYYGLGKTLERLCAGNRIKYYLLCPGFGFFIKKCCIPDRKKRWQTSQEAVRYLDKLQPVEWNLRRFLFSLTAILLAVVFAVAAGNIKRSSYVPIEDMLTPVTAWYYSMDYRSGGVRVRETIENNIERSLCRLLRFYKMPEEQQKLLGMLAVNGELQGNTAKAEAYLKEAEAWKDDSRNEK